MFQIIPNRTKYFTLSGILCSISLVAFLLFSLNYGIDFTGGSMFEIKMTNAELTVQEVQSALDELNGQQITENSEEKIDIGAPLVQKTADNSFLIRVKYIDNKTHDLIIQKLDQINNEKVEELRYETIGPTISADLKQKAILALTLAIIAIILYVAFAFRKIPRHLSPWRFGVTAVIALVHDVLIAIGIFAILGKYFGVEVDSMFITALLTVMGFSVHDTIVVFDRIRENTIIHQHGKKTFDEIANDSINQTMARSINTSITTLFTLLALFFLGGESIKYFVLTLIIGIFVGTYSSIFLATPILVSWRKSSNNK